MTHPPLPEAEIAEVPRDVIDAANKLADLYGDGKQGYAAFDIAVFAILAERQRSQWQPIETAPKNSAEPYICYSPGNSRAHNEYARGPHYHIDGFSERWPRGRNQYPEAPYTHWMPLPSAPSASQAYSREYSESARLMGDESRG